jgi:hypothetical protein
MQKPISYEDSESGSIPYQPERYINPGANLSVYVWFVLLGLPALILFLIYYNATA